MSGFKREELSGKSLRVFIVEDDSIVSLEIENTMLDHGYEVAGWARSAPEASAAIEKTRPDLVLLDIHLSGGGTGIDVARALRKSLDIPIIFLTAFSDNETLKSAREAGPSAYLLKPFNPRELHIAIQMAFENHKIKQELEELKSSLGKSKSEIEVRIFEKTKVLRSREAHLAEAQHLAHLGSWEWDLRDDSVFWSEELYRIFGIESGNARIDLDMLLDHVLPEERKPVFDSIEKARKNGDGLDGIFHIRRPDGAIRTLQSKGQAVRDPHGNTIRLMGIVQDVTEIAAAARGPRGNRRVAI
jgi:PAS domain S-box-containing protein